VSDFDAVVIGAGHNGLMAAAVMARGGMRVFCLEKNHFIGGMASTTELIRGYQFELAGSIQFPLPNEIYDDLGFGACPSTSPRGDHPRRPGRSATFIFPSGCGCRMTITRFGAHLFGRSSSATYRRIWGTAGVL